MTQTRVATLFEIHKSDTGYWAKNPANIFTQGESLDELYKNIIEACESHYDGALVDILWEFKL